MRTIRQTILLLAGALILPVQAGAQQKQRIANLDEALTVSAALSGGTGPQNVNWIEGGTRFSYVTVNGNRPEIRARNPATGQDALLFDGAGLTFPGTSNAFDYESFQWSQDSKYLVFQSNFRQLYRRSGTSDFYVYSVADKALKPAAKNARSAQLSPNGALLGLERDGDMYVYDLASGQEKRLTEDARENVYNGHFDWVYEEEFGEAQAWKWSRDSRYIAFWQTDESAEPYIQLSNYSADHPEWDRIRIPQPGDSNATVRIGVVDVAGARKVWLDPGETGEFYIPRIYWTSEPNTLGVLTLNRAQDEVKLYFFDVTTGAKRLVFSQKSDSWIDVYDFYAGVDDLMTFPEGVREFFWISDQDGHQHIYRYGYDGKLINQVTKGDWTVTRIEGIDAKTRTIYFTSTEPSPVERQLWSIRYDGTAKRRLTTEKGTHTIDMSPDTKSYIDRWTNTTTPRRVVLRSTAGKVLDTLEDNARVSQWIETHAYAPTELFSFTTSDGVKLDGSIIKPLPFDSTKRYPVILSIYGGPGSQLVYDAFGTGGFSQWLAQQGYIIVGVNNRGTGNYSRDFMKVVHEDLGKWESNDFAETARYLAKQRWVDPANIAIMGTSYGGYSTVYTMFAHPDVFRAGIANSPVTDWRLYDTIYTERYMGLLGDNMKGYDSSSAVKKADQLQGRLMLVHSMMDDNVHPVNTMQLLTALTDAGKDVDLRIFPPGAHGAAYNGPSVRVMYRAYFEFLERWLKAGGRQAMVP